MNLEDRNLRFMDIIKNPIDISWHGPHGRKIIMAMKNIGMKLLVAMFSLIPLSCKSNANFNVDDFKNRPERRLETYNGRLGDGIEDKILFPPKEITDYLCKMDSTDGYSAYALSDAEKTMLLQYFGYLPESFQKVIDEKVIAVYFIKNFMGGGMSDFLFDTDGNLLNVLYLNPDILRYSLTEWLSLRDNAPFRENEKIEIKVSCSPEYRGLLHVLLHEASHIYDYHYHFTPYMFKMLANGDAAPHTPFTIGIWKNEYTPMKEYDFLRKTEYSGWGIANKIDKDLSIPLYGNLAKTPFSSLYGSTAWVEDFAETFTWWYLYEYFDIEYKVVVEANGKKAAEYCPSNNARVLSRYAQFQSLR